MTLTAEDVMRILSLTPLQGEGGYFRETYRSPVRVSAEALPAGYQGDRNASTAIFYLLTPDTFSAIHRLRGDEVFHFYFGDPVKMLQLEPDGTAREIVIGTGIQSGMVPQVVVPAGVWQGSRLVTGGRFALMGTTMAPGFDAKDFELGERATLIGRFPAHAGEITALTVENRPTTYLDSSHKEKRRTAKGWR